MRGRFGVWCVVVAALAGCSSAVTPPPGSAPVSTVVPATVVPTTVPRPSGIGLPEVLVAPKVVLPARTRSVSVAGRDPCALLTPAFAGRLGFDQPPGPHVFGLFNDAPGCVVSQSSHAEVLGVLFVTRVGGIDIYNRANIFADELSPLDVAGFPALLMRPKHVAATCLVAVDVAPGEMVEIQVDEGGRKPVTPQDRLCASARRIAVPVLEAVLAG